MKDKTLVAYFAQRGNDISGHCAMIAAKAVDCLRKKGIDAETFVITPVETYPEDPKEMEVAVKAELAARSRPAVTAKFSGMKHVKDIVLVVPNWWNALPPAVTTFLDGYDFNGMRMVPVVSHGGDGGKKIETELRNFLPKTWVMPVVEISDKETDSCDEVVARAISELLAKN